MATSFSTLEDYLARAYPFTVHADPVGGYVVVYPDLPGCMTQVDTLDEIGAMADEARRLWIETEYEQGHQIPEPSKQEGPSGKFVVRMPRSLHRSLVEAAAQENVSLNQYVCTVLARGDAQARVESKLDAVCSPWHALFPAHLPQFPEHTMQQLAHVLELGSKPAASSSTEDPRST